LPLNNELGHIEMIKNTNKHPLKCLKHVAIIIIIIGLITGIFVTGISCIRCNQSEDSQISTQQPDVEVNSTTSHPSGKCGDGICDKLERERGVCPEDCASINSDNTGANHEPGIVYFGFMVHLEGWDNEMNNRNQFDDHANEARKLADIFEDYGAKVTFEASPEFVEACQAWNENVLQELHDRGHGVGVHADKGYYPADSSYNQAQFTFDIRQMKEDMEDLVDFEVQHVSGICSDLDWAKAAIDAGYVFTTGGVGYCCMSMPSNMRPPEYRNCRNPASCHGNMPLNMAERIHPWRIATAKGDWTIDDPGGRLVNLASDGGIKNLYEETLDASVTHGDYEYSDEDITEVVNKVEEAISLSDASKINILYFSLSIGAADVDTDFYTSMFQALQQYVDSGQLEYKTMNEMYGEYILRL
jgi:hypothetical protein